MAKIDVLIELFFTDLPWEKRVAEIAACGYAAVETWGGKDPAMLQAIASAGRDHSVELVSVVLNFSGEDDVAPVRPENRERFLERIDRFTDHALGAGCRQGIVTTGQIAPGGYQAQRAALVEALRAAGERAGAKEFGLNLEPLNTEVDHAGYFLDRREDAVAIVKEVGLPNVKVLYDIYHMAIMAGNQAAFLEHNLPWIGHFHVAGIPGRHEPFDGETNYPFLLAKIAAGGYDGYLGLEYKPLLSSKESLTQTRKYLQ